MIGLTQDGIPPQSVGGICGEFEGTSAVGWGVVWIILGGAFILAVSLILPCSRQRPGFSSIISGAARGGSLGEATEA
jgi:hypothetical protein